ncbi:MAG: hypothetical protein WBH03_11885, partial [Cyclobacteriaceae bacterium]
MNAKATGTPYLNSQPFCIADIPGKTTCGDDSWATIPDVDINTFTLTKATTVAFQIIAEGVQQTGYRHVIAVFEGTSSCTGPI